MDKLISISVMVLALIGIWTPIILALGGFFELALFAFAGVTLPCVGMILLIDMAERK